MCIAFGEKGKINMFTLKFYNNNEYAEKQLSGTCSRAHTRIVYDEKQISGTSSRALKRVAYGERQLQLMQIEIKSLTDDDYKRIAKLAYDNWYKADVKMFNEDHFNAWLYFPEQLNRYIPDDYDRAYYILSKHNIEDAIIKSITDIMNDDIYAILYSYLQLCNIRLSLTTGIDYHLLYQWWNDIKSSVVTELCELINQNL